jgi:esterase/lipase superfamily enzyme
LGGPETATKTLKIDTLVFAAADLDLEVINQRFAAERLLELGKRQVFYVHESDSALGMSTWLFSSGTRLGRLRPETLRAQGRAVLAEYDRLEIIDARVKTPSNFTHSYFYAHPAVLSDMILLLRDGKAAGEANGRPLIRDPSGFWILPKGYPYNIELPASEP